MSIAYGDPEPFVGKNVRVKSGDVVYVAKVIGLAKNTIRATGPTTSVVPWEVQTVDGTRKCVVPGQEEVEEIVEKGFFVDR